jgi:hypothetical protein
MESHFLEDNELQSAHVVEMDGIYHISPVLHSTNDQNNLMLDHGFDMCPDDIDCHPLVPCRQLYPTFVLLVAKLAGFTCLFAKNKMKVTEFDLRCWLWAS